MDRPKKSGLHGMPMADTRRYRETGGVIFVRVNQVLTTAREVKRCGTVKVLERATGVHDGRHA